MSVKKKEIAHDFITRMGAMLHKKGVFFRVWAPHARQVHVAGTFNDWSENKSGLASENNGYWAGNIENAKAADEYKYVIHTDSGILKKNDPYARELTNSAGNSKIVDPLYEWDENVFQMPSWNKMVIYELHVGTFNVKEEGKPGDFYGVIERLGYLKSLGINAIEIMPPTEFPGGFSWGYNPVHPFAMESDYGGVKAFKDMVKAAHQHGIAVIVDIVYNHYGPGDLDLWQFDGWNENGKGGIYFYQDWRAQTPWGESRPDYGRPEVRQYIRDNAMMWFEEYQVDGLRTDAMAFIRNVDGMDDPARDLPEGWSLMRWINEEVKAKFPWKITIAEDLRGNEWITKDPGAGGQGFNAQWDPLFSYPVRSALVAPNDNERDMEAICRAMQHTYNGDAYQRIIYTESHDQVANGASRIPEEIMPGDATSWFSKKRSALGIAVVMTSPGIPMIFQGQELLEDRYFSDTDPIDWKRFSEFKGLAKLYRDLIRLRRNEDGTTEGLSGQNLQIFHVNNSDKVIAYQRWNQGGPKDTVVVILNFADKSHTTYNIGFPEQGLWKIRLNSDWEGYDISFGNQQAFDVETCEGDKDGMPFNGNISIAPYSFIIFSKE